MPGHRGAGALNALTGVASAHRDQVPLLVIGGQVRTGDFGRRPIQDSSDLGINLTAMYSHVTGYSTTLAEPRTFPRILAQAINVAIAPRPCAAYVSVPADLARMVAGDEKAAVPAWRPAFDLPGGHARHVLQALARARRPLIYLGSGAREALAEGRAEFHELVHALRAPVATSLRGKGLFPESDELSLGVLGMAGSERARAYAEAGIDTLVVIGSSLGEWATRGYDRSFTTASAYFHVDLDPSVFGQGVVPLDDDYYFLGEVDLARFAESLGADAHPAADPDGLREALRAARTGAAERSRPQVVVARIDHRMSPPYGERFTAVAGDGS